MFRKDEKKQLRLDFWSLFDQRSRQLVIRNRVGKKWLLHKTEIKGVKLRFSVTEEFAQVAIELEMKPRDERLRWFARFEALKPGFEKIVGQPLQWAQCYNRENLRETSRIFLQADGLNILHQEQWEEILGFITQSMLKLEKAYLRHKDLLKEGEEDE